MKISKISISNILGIESLEFNPGKITIIEGKNGSGKTSILESIKAALKSGTDATLLKQGAKEGEVVLVFDDGTTLIRKLNQSGKANLALTDAQGHIIPKPQSYLDGIYDLLSVNPITFLTADKKNRTQILLETLPLELPKELWNVMPEKMLFKIDEKGHPLEVLATMNKTIFDERTIQNRQLKEKQASAKQLELTLSNVEIGDPNEIGELEQKLNDWEKQLIDYQGKIQAESQKELQELQDEYNTKRGAVKDKHVRQNMELNNTYDEKTIIVKERLAVLRQLDKQTFAIEQTKKTIVEYQEEVKTRESLSSELTTALAKLDAIKLSMLQNLPIEGLEIVEGEIYRHGIAFDRLNMAQQVELAIELARLRAGKLGLICVDGLERLDSETFNEFKTKAIESSLQMFVCRVTNSELSINTENEAETIFD
jgi:energy-coupling factor transporter ATP-binding protein EcfA2